MKKEIKAVFTSLLRISRTSLISVQLPDEDGTSTIYSPAIEKKLAAVKGKNESIISTGGIVNTAIKNKKPVLISSIENKTRLKKLKKLGINSLLVVPFIKKGRGGAIIFFYAGNSRMPDGAIMDVMPSLSMLAAEAFLDISLRKKMEELEKSSNVDGLTGLYNHRYFHESLTKELLRAQRFNYQVSIAMLDIDHFKEYNDTYGHPKGDIVLKDIAGIINSNIRSYDVSARYGGEEFCLIMPYTKKTHAITILERIRKNIARTGFYGKGKKAKITISGGVASFPGNANYESMLIDRADQALYLAKEEGRNRICTSLFTAKDFIKFAFCRPTITNSSFYPCVIKGIRKVIEDVGNIKLTVKVYEKNLKNRDHLRITKGFIKEKMDAVAISSMADVDLRLHTEELNRAGIPVFIFNTPAVIPLGSIVSYAGFDHRGAGRMVAEYLLRIMRRRGKVAIIEGPPEIASIEMKEGFIEVIKESDIKIVACECGEWLRKTARELAKKIIKANPDIDAIWGGNDEMALGATEAIKSGGRSGQIFTIGTDGSLDALESIKDNCLTATLNTNPVEMGKILMRTVIRNTIKDEKIEPYIWSPTNMVDLENVDESIAKII